MTPFHALLYAKSGGDDAFSDLGAAECHLSKRDCLSWSFFIVRELPLSNITPETAISSVVGESRSDIQDGGSALPQQLEVVLGGGDKIIADEETATMLWQKERTVYALKFPDVAEYSMVAGAIASIERSFRSKLLHSAIGIDFEMQYQTHLHPKAFRRVLTPPASLQPSPINSISSSLPDIENSRIQATDPGAIVESSESVDKGVAGNKPVVSPEPLADVGNLVLSGDTAAADEISKPASPASEPTEPVSLDPSKIEIFMAETAKLRREQSKELFSEPEVPEEDQAATAAANQKLLQPRYSMRCHSCFQRCSLPTMGCPNGEQNHVMCPDCMPNYGVIFDHFLDGKRAWKCPICALVCPCNPCCAQVFCQPKSRPKMKPRKPVTPAPTATVVDNIQCLFCKRRRHHDLELPVHPFVRKDGAGQVIHTCSDCLKDIMARRKMAEEIGGLILPEEKNEEVCSVCGDGGTSRCVGLTLCSGASCCLSYCDACLGKLFSRKQVNLMKRVKEWLCPNCTPRSSPASSPIHFESSTDDKIKTPSGRKIGGRKWISQASPEPNGSLVPVDTPRTSQKKPGKKRKRPTGTLSMQESVAIALDTEPKLEPLPVETAPAASLAAVCSATTTTESTTEVTTVSASDNPPPNQQGSSKDAVDYYAMYASALVLQESDPHRVLNESEDSCFSCKDGGELFECDYRRNGSHRSRCPKVYHRECLMETVPEEGRWTCPRHVCFKCGIVKCKYFCRFCPTSFCKNHRPETSTILGAASLELPLKGIYVFCERCAALQAEAIKRQSVPETFSASAGVRQSSHSQLLMNNGEEDVEDTEECPSQSTVSQLET